MHSVKNLLFLLLKDLESLLVQYLLLFLFFLKLFAFALRKQFPLLLFFSVEFLKDVHLICAIDLSGGWLSLKVLVCVCLA